MRTAAKTAFILAILTLGSKVIGLVRELLMANYYGTSYVVDAFFVANSIPVMIVAGVLSAVSTAFIPLFSKKNEEEGEIHANLFTSQTLNILTIVTVVSSLVGIIFSDQLIMIFASGFEGETANLASFYVKVTFSCTFFTTTGNILESYLKYKNVFISPVVAGYSVSLFAVLFIILSHYTSPYIMVFGMLIGYAVRAVILWFISRYKRYRHKVDFHFTDTVKQIFILALPVFLGTTVGQINLFIQRTLATRLPEGSASAISYSDLLIGLITGVTATIVATIMYPKMAQAFASKNYVRFSELYNSGISILLAISLPICLGALLYGSDIIQLVYERGSFDSASTTLTYQAFFYYSLGLVFVSLQGFLVQTFYSMHNTKTPLTISVIAVAINTIACLVLVKYLAHGGLALASTISWIINVSLLIWAIQTKTDVDLKKNTIKKVIKLLFSSIIAVGISWLFYHYIGEVISIPHLVLMLVVIIIATVIYLILLKAFKIEELIHVREIFKISQTTPSVDEAPNINPNNKL